MRIKPDPGKFIVTSLVDRGKVAAGRSSRQHLHKQVSFNAVALSASFLSDGNRLGGFVKEKLHSMLNTLVHFPRMMHATFGGSHCA